VTSGVSRVVSTLEGIQQEFNGSQNSGKQVSLADLIVLGGCAAVEKAAKQAGHDVQVPFAPGRGDASQEQTDVEAFAVLEPTHDCFRNYLQKGHDLLPEHLLVEKAFMLSLSAPQMTALLGGLRVLNANVGQSEHGIFTARPETLTNDFFVNLLDIGTAWSATSESEEVFEGRDRNSGAHRWTGSRVDLIFGSNSELRALAEVYASSDAQEKFVRDFVAAWDKVMNLDRFDLA
jgi:catalase-peroxidase